MECTDSGVEAQLVQPVCNHRFRRLRIHYVRRAGVWPQSSYPDPFCTLLLFRLHLLVVRKDPLYSCLLPTQFRTIRQTLFKGPREIPTNTIKGLWCSLDADLSNSIDKEEAGAFLRRGVSAAPTMKPPSVKDFNSDILYGPMGRVGMNRPVDSTPTVVMLDQLKAADVALPTDEELTALSEQLNEWIAAYRKQVLTQESKPSWFNIYAIIDQVTDRPCHAPAPHAQLML